ncbi:TniQ family protein [Aeromonas veronii]
MIIPLHPQPIAGEILSSWMVRIAFANRYPLHTFYNKLLGYHGAIWNQDIDRHPDDSLLHILSKYTGQSMPVLKSMTLESYTGSLFEHIPSVGNSPWITPLGLFHRTRKRPGMQFCPECLMGNKLPFYRRCWRLSIYAICDLHNCVLADSCPSCCEPIAYHRHGIGRDKIIPETDALFYCHNCWFDLRNSPKISINWFDNNSMQELLFTIGRFEQGYWNCGKLTPPCSILFFKGLKALMTAIRGRNGSRLRKILYDICGVEIVAADGSLHTEWEGLSSINRAKLLLVTFWVLGDWPNRFVELCREAKFTRSRLAERVDELPFWISSVAVNSLDNRIYIPNDAEIIAAGHYLNAHNINVSASSLRKILGLCPSTALKTWSFQKDKNDYYL